MRITIQEDWNADTITIVVDGKCIFFYETEDEDLAFELEKLLKFVVPSDAIVVRVKT